LAVANGTFLLHGRGAFTYQETIDEETQGPGHVLLNTAAPFTWSTTPVDEMTSVSDECGRWQDERTAVSSSLMTDVQDESEYVDVVGENNVSCDLISRHINEVDARLSGGGEKVVSRHIVGDTEAEKSWDEAASCTATHSNPAANTSHTTNTRPYVCDICAESFMTAIVFGIHRQTRHISRRLYECDVCLQNFTDCSSLRKHMFAHKSEMCQKRFSWPSSLQSQTHVRSAKNLHECEVCRRRFSKLVSLQVHKRIHYGCHSCCARFSGPDSLKTHMMLHAEPPTQCHSTSNHVNTGSDAPAVKQVSNCFLIVFTTSWSDIAVCIC